MALAIVRERGGALTLTTMRYDDEARDPKDVEAATQKAHKPTHGNRAQPPPRG